MFSIINTFDTCSHLHVYTLQKIRCVPKNDYMNNHIPHIQMGYFHSFLTLLYSAMSMMS